MPDPRIGIVVPTYNEVQNLAPLCDRIAAAMPAAALLLVDDASPDGTADAAASLFSSDPRFAAYRVMRRTGPRGLGRAYRDGFRTALDNGWDVVIQMDADLSHDPADLTALVRGLASSDLVIGSRYCPGGRVANWPAHRLALSRFACWYVRRVAGVRVADPTAGYRCWSAAALRAVDLSSIESEGYSFQVETVFRAVNAGLRVAEAPICFTDRREGRSKMSRRVLVESCILPWRLRFGSRRAQRLAGPDAPAERTVRGGKTVETKR